MEMLYETEALTEMAIRRSSQPAVRNLVRLIADKCHLMDSEVAGWNPDAWTLTEEDGDLDTDIDRVQSNLYDALEEASSEKEKEDEESDDVALAENEMREIVAMATADPENEPAPLEHDAPQALELMTPELDPEIKESPDEVGFNPPPGYFPEDEEDKEEKAAEDTPKEVEFVEEEDMEEPESTEEESDAEDEHLSSPRADRAPLLTFFTINDRFRFRRSLFGGENPRFLETVGVIESVDNLRQAEDYMTDDLQWDLENPEVRQFCKIVERYFKSSEQ